MSQRSRDQSSQCQAGCRQRSDGPLDVARTNTAAFRLKLHSPGALAVIKCPSPCCLSVHERRSGVQRRSRLIDDPLDHLARGGNVA